MAELQAGGSSDSSGDEPWDEVPRTYSGDLSSGDSRSNKGLVDSADTMRNHNNATNEVGDLPALNLSRSEEDSSRKSLILSGQKRTLRPLSPPSQAGLPQERDDVAAFIDDDDVTGDLEEMPMDERLDHEMRKQEALCVEGGGILDNNICDYTFTAMGELCGISPGNAKNPKDSPYSDTATKPKSPTRKLPVMKAPYGVEEQTAIEVEYVEPEQRQDTRSDFSTSSSPRRKNMLVQAMARRAKETFERTKGRGGGSVKKTKVVAKPEEKAKPPDNVYSSFNASEKRKFLTLINSGLTPSDATQQVLKEREEGEAAMEQVGEGSSSKNSMPRLAFWKKNKEDKDIPNEIPVNDEDAGAALSKEKEDEDSVAFAKSGINYYDAVRKDRSMEAEDEEFDGAEVAATNRKVKTKNRGSLFGKAGFSKLSTREESFDDALGNTSNQVDDAPQGTRTVTPPPMTTSQPISPPSPINMATAGQSEGLAEARGIFKPVDVQEDSDRKIEPSLSDDDSLLRDEDSEVDAHPPPQQRSMTATAAALGGVTAAGAIAAASYIEPKTTDTSRAIPEEKKEDHHTSRSIEEEMEVQLLTGQSPDRKPNTDQELAKTPGSSAGVSSTRIEKGKPELKVDVTSIDLDFDPNVHSTEVLSSYGGSVADHLSVVSSKSYRTAATAYTQGTNYTTSSRRRRPGAAKQRMASQSKNKEKVVRGWQESIQMAAANTNRMWDPKLGWVDYVDPDKAIDDPTDRREDKIHVDINRLQRSTSSDSAEFSDEQAESIAVPFPDQWEQERQAMLERGEDPSVQLSPPVKPVPQRTKPPSPSRSSANKQALPSPPRSRGWVETMKEATANLPDNKGKRWDPRQGWVDASGAIAPAAEGVDRYGGSVSEQAPNDTADFGTITVTPSPPKPNLSTARSLPTPEPLSKPDPPEPLSKPDPKGQAVVKQNDDEHSELGAASMRSGKSGRYVQLGDTGSVKSFYRGGKPSMTRSSPVVSKIAPKPATTPEMFGNLDEARKQHDEANKQNDFSQRNSLLVNVVKERVDSEDASFFPDIHERRSGPVDLDEIDDQENSSFGMPVDFSWDQDDTNVSDMLAAANPPNRQSQGAPQNDYSSKKAVPTLKVNIRDTSPRDGSAAQLSKKSMDSKASGEKSFDTLSTSSKSIPRLRGPRRDTSPIRGRRSSSQTAEPAVVSIEKKEVGPDPVGKQGVSPLSQSGVSPPGQIASAQRRPTPGESPPGSAMPIVEQARTAKSPGGDPDASYSTDSSPRDSVKVKARYWENKSKSPEKDPSKTNYLEMPMQATEWKTFLAKKVQAENAASATLKARSHSEDHDSLFEFPGSEGAFPSAKQRPMPMGTPPSDGMRSLEKISNLSPIRVQDEEDDILEGTLSETSSFAVQPTSFLQRLQACAAPIVPRTKDGQVNCNTMPMAHLAFLRQNPSGGTPEKETSSSRFVPPSLCGRPDVIVEENEDEETGSQDVSKEKPRQKGEKSRSRSNPRASRQSGDVSSVISDEQFGHKTAYLEAVAMKAAVSGSKRSKRRSAGSDVSSSSSRHSDKWQRFLEKKKKQQDGNDEGNGSEQVSRTAEKYAAEKVEEMMEIMAKRSNPGGTPQQFEARPMEEATGAFPSLSSSSKLERKNDSKRTAEDLAAARVEAMMHALSTQQLEEDEAEI